MTKSISQELKTIFDITNQPIGSAEFKIEVASACAESGINYIEFAKMYNLNADELNAWALEFLGTDLEKDVSVEDEFNSEYLNVADKEGALKVIEAIQNCSTVTEIIRENLEKLLDYIDYYDPQKSS